MRSFPDASHPGLRLYLERIHAERTEFDEDVEDIEPDPAYLDGDEVDRIPNPLFQAFQADSGRFYELTGFSAVDFNSLLEIVRGALRDPARGRRRVIGPIDSLFLFLHWMRTGNPIDTIANVMGIKGPTLYSNLKDTVRRIHPVLVARCIQKHMHGRLLAGEKFHDCGLIVDATVQKRGRPVGDFEEAKKYFSGKHWIYCLKSQVIINREGLGVHVVAGLPGSIHDLELFRQNVTGVVELITQHQGQPSKILADKGYIGDSGSPMVIMVTPRKPAPRGVLSNEDMKYNKKLSSVRVLVENFFGRMSTKFHLMVRRWGFGDSYYKLIFELATALVNFDIEIAGVKLTAQDALYHQRLLTRLCDHGRRDAEAAQEKVKTRNQRRRESRTSGRDESGDESGDDEQLLTAVVTSSRK